MYIVLAIIAFGVLILVHEGGHFFAARLCGVKVNEFAIGMGPKILKKQGKETLFTLRLLPFGGFCALEGEDEETGDERAFAAKPKWQRIVILCAGAAMNFLIGLIMLFCIMPWMNVAEPVIAGFMEGCPYVGEDALMEGDRILRVDGHRIYFTTDFSEYMSRGGDDVHTIVLRRDGERVVLKDFTMSLVAYPTDSGGSAMKYGLYFQPRGDGLWTNLRYTWYEGVGFVRLVWRSLGDLFTGAVGLRDFSGPVGVVGYVNEVEQQTTSALEAFFTFFYIFSLIAVNLAVVNLLPIPGLDGGRVFLLIVTSVIEGVSGKKLDPKYEGYINMAGLVLLLSLSAYILFNDVWKLFSAAP